MRALHAHNDRRFRGRDKADPMTDHDFRQAKFARGAFGDDLAFDVPPSARCASYSIPVISRPSSSARTTPQKSTIAPAAGSFSRAGKSSGDWVIETSQTEIAMRY